ncbi:zinc ribbon domain-containing protein [Ruminococcus sp. Marseille-P6503]|uniref:zinc ribbon domain-containing protein n=1 Tax=Ruminococcus sp. Marseille-P6503 TaxID=2364796 RepID=UPI000F537E63|nr:zinc ribbon domain-containing protein [Ruminococcus sp. Marseille-P6503]
MKCKFCGNEVVEGEKYCSCGNPVTYDESVSTEQISADNSDLQSAPSVAVSTRKRGIPRALASILVVVVIALAGLGYTYYKNMYSLTHSSTYKEVSESEFTMKIPRTLKKDSSGDSESVAFYTSEMAAVNIVKYDYSTNPEMELISPEDYMSLAEVGSFDGEFKKDGDLVYACYNDSTVGTLGDTQECYVIEGLFKGDDAMWSVNAYCLSKNKEDYEDALIEWVKSFKLK